MSDLSVEDFKNILLDLYLVQRENAELRGELALLKQPHLLAEERADEEV
jgi:hypothetical protein